MIGRWPRRWLPPDGAEAHCSATAIHGRRDRGDRRRRCKGGRSRCSLLPGGCSRARVRCRGGAVDGPEQGLRSSPRGVSSALSPLGAPRPPASTDTGAVQLYISFYEVKTCILPIVTYSTLRISSSRGPGILTCSTPSSLSRFSIWGHYSSKAHSLSLTRPSSSNNSS